MFFKGQLCPFKKGPDCVIPLPLQCLIHKKLVEGDAGDAVQHLFFISQIQIQSSDGLRGIGGTSLFQKISGILRCQLQNDGKTLRKLVSPD